MHKAAYNNYESESDIIYCASSSSSSVNAAATYCFPLVLIRLAASYGWDNMLWLC